MIVRALVAACLIAVGGCGLMGGDGAEEDAPTAVCPREDPPKRRLVGAAIRQPDGVPLYEALRVDGKAARSGALSRIWLGDYTFRARGDGSGGYTGRRGAAAEPIPGLSGVTALSMRYTMDGQAYSGSLAIGRPTPAAQVATVGEARYSGPVRLELRDLAAGTAPVETEARIDVDVRFGSADARTTISGLGAVPELAALDWSGLVLCNTRLASSGQGGFRFRDPDGRAVNFAGPGQASPNGSALFDATFYGFDANAARPATLAGIVLIQGDAGLMSGVFSAGLTSVSD